MAVFKLNLESKEECKESTHKKKEKPFNKRFHIKQNPNPAFYLQKFDKFPIYLDSGKFLNKNVFEKVILTSYPRSGNTLLRKYIEDITGVITGSDWDVKRRLNSDLVEMGMRGEGKVNFHISKIQ